MRGIWLPWWLWLLILPVVVACWIVYGLLRGLWLLGVLLVDWNDRRRGYPL